MTDIVTTIDSVNLNILGGPSSIEVSVDYGQQGDRGSIFMFGQGKPNLVTLQQVPVIFDMYINLLPSDDEYQWVYQYISTPSGNAWTPLFKMQPNTYSVNAPLAFTNGTAEIWIPLLAITGASELSTVLSSANFNVQHSIISSLPSASSITLGDVSVSPDEILALPVTINLAEFSDGAFALSNGERIVHLFVTVV